MSLLFNLKYVTNGPVQNDVSYIKELAPIFFIMPTYAFPDHRIQNIQQLWKKKKSY